MSEQQEEILYFVKESIELENKQIQEVMIGQFYIVLVSFSGSIYIFEKGNEKYESLDEDNFFMNGQNKQIMDQNQEQKCNNLSQQQSISHENKQIEKKKSLFLDFDHKLELPFAKTLILTDSQKEIQLLIVAKNGEMCNLTIQLDQFKIVSYQQKAQTLQIPKKEEKQIKNAKIIENSRLLITYVYEIFLVSKINNSMQVQQANLIFEGDEEIDQTDYYENLLCISTYKRYYALNIQSLKTIKLGSKEKQGFFGISFFPRNQNEFVMAARPNGYMWKVETIQGEVQKTLQFKDEDNNKLIFGRLYAFNRYILSINGQNKLLIIDMNDKQQITKVYPNCSQLSFVYDHINVTQKNDANEKSFYLFYMENGKNLVIERCSIKNIQRSFEASLSKNFVGQCAELFEKYEALQNIKNLKSILKANNLNPQPQRFQFSSSFKDSVKKIEDDQFRWVREKEIDQKEFKQSICSQQNKNGQLTQENQIHNKLEGDIVKIIDLENIYKKNNQKKLEIKQVNPKKCVIYFNAASYDIQLNCNQNQQNIYSNINDYKIINNKNKSNSQKKKNKQAEQQKKNQQQEIIQNIQQFNIKRNSININKNSNHLNNIIQNHINIKIQQNCKLTLDTIDMLQQSIKPFQVNKDTQCQTFKDCQNFNNQQNNKEKIDSYLIQKYNTIINQKINQYGRYYFKKHLIKILMQRNQDLSDFIQTNLSKQSLLFIINLLSRNFIKSFIYSQNKYLSQFFFQEELKNINQIKSSIDMFNDKYINIQINKLQMLQYLKYYFGDQIFLEFEQQECKIDFDEISDIINNMQKQ